jgi:chromosomal replication initiator protein
MQEFERDGFGMTAMVEYGKSGLFHEDGAADKTLAKKAGRATQWAYVKSRLSIELGDATFSSWVKPLDLIGIGDGQVMISAPTRFIRSWVLAHQSERLLLLWQDEDDTIDRVEILVNADTQKTDAETPLPGDDAVQGQALHSQSVSHPQSTPLTSESGHQQRTYDDVSTEEMGAPLDERFTFENFVVGQSNELAHAAARCVAEATDVTFNPLFLYGGVGLGKTHLMHAIAWEIRHKHPDRKVLYLSAEKFMYQFVRALRFEDMMAFKQQFRAIDVLMIDDIQFISGKDSTQEEFFHTLNALIDHNHQVIISADRSPSDLEGIEERIRSRLGWGLVADIHPTDYELRLGILQAKSNSRALRTGAIEMPPGVLELLAQRITNNIRELEGALTRVIACASLIGRPITLDMVQEVLRDLLRTNENKVTLQEIQRRVAQYYNIRLVDLLSSRRLRAVASPRQIAMYLSKLLTTREFSEIGKAFGERCESTVISHVVSTERLHRKDEAIAKDIDLLLTSFLGDGSIKLNSADLKKFDISGALGKVNTNHLHAVADDNDDDDLLSDLSDGFDPEVMAGILSYNGEPE